MEANKLMALIVGIMMLSTTVLAADQYSLATYPAPFVKDGIYDATIVVGDNAKVEDVLGAIDIAAHLQANSVVPKEIEWKTSPEITGGEVGKVTLGNEVTTEIEAKLTDDDVAGLQDTTVELDGTDYDIHDELVLGTGLKLETSLTANDEDYENKVYLEINKGSIAYNYVFDEAINLSNLEEELVLEFLGVPLTIIGTEGNDEIEVRIGKELYIKQDDAVTIDNHTIKLVGVSTNEKTAIVEVDGAQVLVDTGKAKKVNGLEIRIKDAFSSDTRDAAILIAGTSTIETYSSGDAYIGEDEDDPEWVWSITDLDTTHPKLGVVYDITRDNLDDEPITVTGCYKLPEDFAQLCLNRLTETSYQPYKISIDDSYDDIDDVYDGKANQKVVVLESADEAFKLGSFETGEVVLWLNNSVVDVFYKDAEDNDLKYYMSIQANKSTAFGTIDFQDTSLDLVLNTPVDMTVPGYVELVVKSPLVDDDLKLSVRNSNGFTNFGPTKEQAESLDLAWDGRNIGTNSDSMTKYGIVIDSPENTLDDDYLSLSIPASQVEAEIVVAGTNTAAVGGTLQAGYEINQMETPVAKLSSELGATDTNLIVVGGPCVNPVFEAASGISCSEWMLEDGQSMIKLVPYKTGYALLVAGTQAMDTRNACDALVNHKLTNGEVLIEGTSLFNYQVKQPVAVNATA